MACEPQELTTLAGCFNSLLPNQLAAIQTYLLAVMAEVDPDVAALSEASKCFANLNSGQLLPIQTYLLCQILEGGGGGGGGTTQVFPLAGASTPAAVPTGGGIAYNATGQVWIYTGGAWSLVLS